MSAGLKNHVTVGKPWEQLVRDRELDLSKYETFYKDLHQSPELSRQEYKTAVKVAGFLRELEPDLDIRTAIGGTGLIAILRNGVGKALLLRADMDALPLQEKTGLDYASKETALDSNGKMVSVTHGR